ncbi:MAG: crotonase/enoyl-CoA hydratase family protein [Deltaproteobacteria bacterium]|nr:crotonase/enoyl-CoA hydratase family protein [Deltaproteobacteria bacterium]
MRARGRRRPPDARCRPAGGGVNSVQARARQEHGVERVSAVRVQQEGPVYTVILDRPERRNAVDRETAEALADAFEAFDAEPTAKVGVLVGEHGSFCAGADLKAVAEGRPNRLEPEGRGPMGPSRMLLSKPVIAAIEGHAVAGGLELALWCDLRVAAEDAILGVFCRRFGVPLIDGGTVRLPRLVGLSRALDLILTGRGVDAQEALQMGLVNRVVPSGTSRAEAERLASSLAEFPQACLRADRASAYEAFDQPMPEALRAEFERGVRVLADESVPGAQRFSAGAGRHGRFG